ncbi:MAG: glycoside hydrolase family 28 protein [Promethearchaeota archaeon]
MTRDIFENLNIINILDHGAVGDGEKNNARAIDSAILACHEKGGGIVFFPAGKYKSGTIHVQSKVTLFLSPGCTLMTGPDDDIDDIEDLDYIPHADMETTYFNCSLISCREIEDFCIMGGGVIDGNRTRRGGPKPIGIKQCRNVVIRDITVKNAPNYSISLIDSEHVVIENVRVLNGLSDGIDLDGCRFARITNCIVESWDDGICLKSSPALKDQLSTQYISISNCHVASGSNCFKLGTESYGAFKDISISNCTFYPLPFVRHPRGGIAIEAVDGAHINRLVATNITMNGMDCPIFIWLGNRGTGQETPKPGKMMNITISNITATDSYYPSVIAGIPGVVVENISISNIVVSYGVRARPHVEDMPGIMNVPEKINAYPDPKMYKHYPAWAFYIRHARNIQLSAVILQHEFDKECRAIACDDVNGILMKGFQVLQGGKVLAKDGIVNGVTALIEFTNVSRASLQDFMVESVLPVFLKYKIPALKEKKVVLLNNFLPDQMITYSS